MLIYCNHFCFASSTDIAVVLQPIARWLTRKLRRSVSIESIRRGGELMKSEGWLLRSIATVERYPHLLSIELIHPDRTVNGRRWHTEIGIQHRGFDADLEVTILVKTSEISARVTDPIRPGAPNFVEELLASCELSSTAVGVDYYSLCDDDADSFREFLLDPRRGHPLVVISPTHQGDFLVDASLLSKLLIGIAEVVEVSPGTDTFWLARSVGSEYIPYRGAIKILHPLGTMGRIFFQTVTREALVEIEADPRAVAHEIFSLVLHRTNVPMSWRHISPERVRTERLWRELQRRRMDAEKSGDTTEYLGFLEEYIKEIEANQNHLKDETVRLSLELDNSKRVSEEEQRQLKAKNEALMLQLERAGSEFSKPPFAAEDLDVLATTIAAAIKRAPTPEECLRLIEHLYADRLRILPEAWTSARESAKFKDGKKLFDLLQSLAGKYWLSLSSGRPDQEARQVFGNAYAARESDTVSNNRVARKKRALPGL